MLLLAGLVSGAAAQGQVAAAIGLDSSNRYRGTGTDDVGPVLRLSVMADSTSDITKGAYAGLSGLWRTGDAGLANAEAMIGWSGRLNAIGGFESLEPGWGWDVGIHRMHYGDGTYDYNEGMVGVLAPGVAVRAWWASHNFGGPSSSLYTELNGSRDLDDRWRVFAHIGVLRYGDPAGGGPRVPGRTDALAGIGYVLGAWDFRLTRDGLIAGSPPDDIDSRQRRPAWVLGGSVAF